MRHILLTELETTGSTSCKIKGLPETEVTALQKAVTDLQIVSTNLNEFFEADTQGFQLLNMLCNSRFKILGQSMVIEKSNIGSRTILMQKIVWTLGKA